MQKYHDEPKQYKGYLKSALGNTTPTPGDAATAFRRQVSRPSVSSRHTTRVNISLNEIPRGFRPSLRYLKARRLS